MAAPAAAQAVAPATVPALGWLLGAAGLAAALVGSWFARRTFGRLAGDLAAARQRAAALDAVLAEAPVGWLRWREDGDVVCAPHLARSLGVAADVPGGLERFAHRFPEAAFAELRDRAAALRAAGTPFGYAIATVDGRLAFQVVGVHAAAEDGRQAVLWFRDITAQQEAERLLAQRIAEADVETDRLRRVLDAAPLATWRRGEDLALSWANRAYLNLALPPGAVAPAGGPPEIESRSQLGQGRQLARSAVDSGGPAWEVRHFVVEGQRRALRIEERPEPAGGGTLGFALDVTELEEAEAQLRRHVKANGEVLNQLTTAIAIFGPDRRLAFFNAAYARLWRYDDDWLVERPTHAELLDAARDARLLPEQADYPAYKRQTLAKYTSLLEPEETLVYMPNGTSLRAVTAPHPFGGLVQIFEDVTDRLRLERSYNTLIAVQRETLDNLGEGVALYGGDGRLKLFNPAFARIWQLDPKWLESEPHVAEIADATRELFPARMPWPALRKILVGNVTERVASSRRLERPDGMVLESTGVPLPDGNMLYTYLDVSDSAAVERALRDRNDALETADRLKSEFIANISYELRTPLNIIIGFAEILSHEYFGPLNERQKEYGTGILESSYQLLSLINDILDLAGFEAGQFALDLEQIDVSGLLTGVLAITRERARKSRLTLEFDCPPDVGSIEADERRLKQVLLNIVANAIKFTPAGGRVALRARREGEQVAICVADTGVGIAREEQAMVFEKFQRGRGVHRGQGAGLGLSLAKNIVELHEGTIELESEVGVGTRITCRLPVRQRQSRLQQLAH